MKKADGFTFVEVLVVSVVLLVLASAVLPLARVSIQRTREAELRRSLREMRTAIDKYKDAVDLGLVAATEVRAGSEGYPPSLEILVEGVEVANDASGRKLKFLRRIPIDPMTGDVEWGLRSVLGQTRLDVLGRRQRLRRIHEGRWHRARRHEVQRLVMMARRAEIRPAPAACLRRQGGWTLIELMVVVALITLLAGMAVAQYRNSVIRAQEAVLKTDLFRMRDAIDQYYADKAKYPTSLQQLVSEGYLRQLPEDPFTNSSDTWQEVPAEPDPTTGSTESGVFDVKSGSDKMSLDGRMYSEW